ncbi:glycosyltransferase family 2 protein [Azospirillum rugosum]|uniref:Dolichol-phosphate mannosyltransferase n=1 Tax=Azospirillum rugosum TaxID=416170 RepID=A0ABS4SSS9_9PROT|nr:glycosyltransferase family 2 protein [Azospirillum rugosum]MBP2295619.1 dolichol-phosphate mannosyltransferase [Azospirillum rugosum]MDQ0529491.1 dolichol-phosphate mannosyltransferase [Azospirillum rugosum]
MQHAVAGGPRLSVVVPCYNEADGVGELHRRVSAACRAEVGSDYELVLVDDGSRDDTWGRIAALVRDDPAVTGVRLSRNHGHQLALTAGLHVCRGERILIIDADLQDPPELLGTMMARMDAGADVVYGTRTARDGETWFKKGTAALFYRVLDRLVDIEIPKDTGDFRLMSRRALEVLNAMPEQHRFIRGMVSWIGLKQEPLPYDRQARVTGTTKYPLSKMIRFAVDAITSFSIKPLRAASYIGFFFAVCAVLALGYALFSWAQHETVPGWTSVMVVTLVLGSTQLLILGVLGEYLGRLYMETKHRPLYIVESVARHPDLVGAAVPGAAAPPVPAGINAGNDIGTGMAAAAGAFSRIEARG